MKRNTHDLGATVVNLFIKMVALGEMAFECDECCLYLWNDSSWEDKDARAALQWGSAGRAQNYFLNNADRTQQMHDLTPYIRQPDFDSCLHSVLLSAFSFQLMKCVRLPLLSRDFLMSNVDTELLVRHHSECKDLLIEALKYHLMPEQRGVLSNSRTRPRRCEGASTVLFAVGKQEQSMSSNCGKDTGSEAKKKPDREGLWGGCSLLVCKVSHSGRFELLFPLIPTASVNLFPVHKRSVFQTLRNVLSNWSGDLRDLKKEQEGLAAGSD